MHQTIMEPLHKKTSSIIINQKLLNQINSMIQERKFSSISDIVNTAMVFFLGELSIEKTNPNFDYAAIVENMPTNNLERAKISVSLSGYLDAELENLAKATQRNKSFIVRMALSRFFEVYNNTEKITIKSIVPEEKASISKSELNEMIHETVREIVPEIIEEYTKIEEKLVISKKELEKVIYEMINEILKK